MRSTLTLLLAGAAVISTVPLAKAATIAATTPGGGNLALGLEMLTFGGAGLLALVAAGVPLLMLWLSRGATAPLSRLQATLSAVGLTIAAAALAAAAWVWVSTA